MMHSSQSLLIGILLSIFTSLIVGFICGYVCRSRNCCRVPKQISRPQSFKAQPKQTVQRPPSSQQSYTINAYEPTPHLFNGHALVLPDEQSQNSIDLTVTVDHDTDSVERRQKMNSFIRNQYGTLPKDYRVKRMYL